MVFTNNVAGSDRRNDVGNSVQLWCLISFLLMSGRLSKNDRKFRGNDSLERARIS